MVQKLYVLDEGHKIYQYEYLSLTAALLSSFLKGFRESFLTAPILLTLAQSVKDLPLFKMLPNSKFSSAGIDFSLVAAL